MSDGDDAATHSFAMVLLSSRIPDDRLLSESQADTMLQNALMLARLMLRRSPLLRHCGHGDDDPEQHHGPS